MGQTPGSLSSRRITYSPWPTWSVFDLHKCNITGCSCHCISPSSKTLPVESLPDPDTGSKKMLSRMLTCPLQHRAPRICPSLLHVKGGFTARADPFKPFCPFRFQGMSQCSPLFPFAAIWPLSPPSPVVMHCSLHSVSQPNSPPPWLKVHCNHSFNVCKMQGGKLLKQDC